MLSHFKLPKSFWGEAMRTSIDLINLSPLVPLKGDVHERVWTRKEACLRLGKGRASGLKALTLCLGEGRSFASTKNVGLE